MFDTYIEYNNNLIMKLNKCLKYVLDKKTKKRRRCKHSTKSLYCPAHFKNEFCLWHETTVKCVNVDVEHGLCCFCGSPCNSSSQTCGRCPRNFMMENFWK